MFDTPNLLGSTTTDWRVNANTLDESVLDKEMMSTGAGPPFRWDLDNRVH